MLKLMHNSQTVAWKEKAIRAGMRLWYLKTMGGKLEIPTPVDPPVHHSGTRAWRVLLFGNGPTHGWGVLSHHFSLTGQLGMVMSDYRGVPVNIDYVGDELMTVETAERWLQDVDVAAYDQIILSYGLNDAMRFTSQATWREGFDHVWARLQNGRKKKSSIVVLGIEPLDGVDGYGGLPGRLAQPNALAMNDYMAQVVAEANSDCTKFLALSRRVKESSRPMGSPTTYRTWATEIAAVAAPLLPCGAAPEVPVVTVPQFNWIGSRFALGFGVTRIPNNIKDIEADAKAAFGVDLAQVTILDGARQWLTSHSGPAPQSIPQELTYCNVVAQQREPLIIPNSKKDARFKDNPYLDISSMPFYAGQALLSRDGDVIGSFCLLGITPRPRFAVPMRKFKRFAQRAQAEMWRIEDEARKVNPDLL